MQISKVDKMDHRGSKAALRRDVARHLYRYMRRYIKLQLRGSSSSSRIASSVVLADDVDNVTIYPHTANDVQMRLLQQMAKGNGVLSALFIVTDETERASALTRQYGWQSDRLFNGAIEIWHAEEEWKKQDDMDQMNRRNPPRNQQKTSMTSMKSFAALLPAHGCMVVCHPVDTLLSAAIASNQALLSFLQELH